MGERAGSAEEKGVFDGSLAGESQKGHDGTKGQKNQEEGFVVVRLSASEFKQDMSETLNRVAYQGERVVIHRRGKDVAVVITLPASSRAVL